MNARVGERQRLLEAEALGLDQEAQREGGAPVLLEKHTPSVSEHLEQNRRRYICLR